ncbi:MAG: hypothetical protein HY881_26110 [Deltaproteobacteria bacterium]|nr:hypothetical protein [Deltaproteobacteria bacterium]
MKPVPLPCTGQVRTEGIVPVDGASLAGQVGPVQQMGMSARIEGMIAPLQQMDRNVSGLLTRIDHDAGALTQDIETTIQGITVHEKISAEIRKVILELESMVERMCVLYPALAGDPDSKEMADMTGRYTMEREREIHLTIAGTVAVLPAAAVQSQEIPPDAGEDLGDNVELF